MTGRVERYGGSPVTIDRPEARNAVDPDTADTLFRTFLAFDKKRRGDLRAYCRPHWRDGLELGFSRRRRRASRSTIAPRPTSPYPAGRA